MTLTCEFCGTKVSEEYLTSNGRNWLDICVAGKVSPSTYFCSMECLYLDLHHNWRPYVQLTSEMRTGDSVN